ncbi:hypothetical protein QBC35DRAFT_442056 [Podospora australis]|uniref:Uncharacterized protein n=1 Tax=Podospora australis TaxID=1536484 RepID=A0AAN6WPR7_9PEZI|nr:hypothetical protein QBC35DRAFT_442056 [Podospora australis]
MQVIERQFTDITASTQIFRLHLDQALRSITKIAEDALPTGNRQRFPLQISQESRYPTPINPTSSYHQQRSNQMSSTMAAYPFPPNPSLHTTQVPGQLYLNQLHPSSQPRLHLNHGLSTYAQNHAAPQHNDPIAVQPHASRSRGYPPQNESFLALNAKMLHPASTMTAFGSKRVIPQQKPADSFDDNDAARCLQNLATATKISSTGTNKRKSPEGPESDGKRRRTASFSPLHRILEAPAGEPTPVKEDTLAEEETPAKEETLAKRDIPVEEETLVKDSEPIKDEVVCTPRTVILAP